MIFQALFEVADILSGGALGDGVDAVGEAAHRQNEKSAARFYYKCLTEGLSEEKSLELVKKVYG